MTSWGGISLDRCFDSTLAALLQLAPHRPSSTPTPHHTHCSYLPTNLPTIPHLIYFCPFTCCCERRPLAHILFAPHNHLVDHRGPSSLHWHRHCLCSLRYCATTPLSSLSPCPSPLKPLKPQSLVQYPSSILASAHSSLVCHPAPLCLPDQPTRHRATILSSFGPTTIRFWPPSSHPCGSRPSELHRN